MKKLRSQAIKQFSHGHRISGELGIWTLTSRAVECAVNDYIPLPHLPTLPLGICVCGGRCGVLARARARWCGTYRKDRGMQKQRIQLLWKNLEWPGEWGALMFVVERVLNGLRVFSLLVRAPYFSFYPASTWSKFQSARQVEVQLLVIFFFLLSYGLWVCYCAVLKVSSYYKKKFQWYFSRM